ncbi:MAG: hypothetical protein GF372_04440 [Candidatus Marinimicrobia bacterium]|nr:hypothetical protein [Candidatus Neomarinimicrobiota bacterium]
MNYRYLHRFQTVRCLFYIALFICFLGADGHAHGQNGDILLSNCTIYPMDSDKIIEHGFIYIDDGSIVSFGQGEYSQLASRTINLQGSSVLPAFIDMHRESIPDEEKLRALYASGITTIAVRQTSDSLFGGWSRLVQLLPDSLGGPQIITNELDYQINLNHYFDQDADLAKYDPFKQKHNFYRIRQVFDGTTTDSQEKSRSLEQIISYAQRSGSFYFYTHSLSELLILSRLISEYNIQGYFGGANHISELLELTLDPHTPLVVVGPSIFSRHNRFNDEYVVPTRLSELAHKYALATFQTSESWLSLLDQVRLLNSYGVTEFEALRSVTGNPGEHMSHVGSFGLIEDGARANLVIFDGNPMDVDSEVSLLIVDGKVIDLR